MKENCDIIRDLLPLYRDAVCSEASRQAVCRHLQTCEACAKELERMNAAFAAPHAEVTEEAAMAAASSAWKKSKRKAFRRGAVIAAAALLSLFVWLNWSVLFQRGNPVPYLAAALRIDAETPFVPVGQEGAATVYITRRGDGQPLLEHVRQTTGLPFQEQAGSGFLFYDETRRLTVTAEVYWGRYSVWEVPNAPTAR